MLKRPWGSLFFLFLCYALVATFPARSQVSQDAGVRPRITQRIDESSLLTLHGNTPPQAYARNDIGAAPGSLAASRLVLVLARSGAQEASLQTWLNSVQNANSPDFQKWMTPEEFGARFGVSEADLARVEGWLQGHGFTINKVAPGRMSLEFSGTTAQVESTFHTSIHSFLANGVKHWANTSDPQIPAALAPVVAGVARLNDFYPRSNAVRGPGGVYNPATNRIEPSYTIGDTTNGYYFLLGPADAATIYNTPTSLNGNHGSTLYDGTGATIGIAGDSNIDIQQNANYRATFGLPAKATTVVVDGDDPGKNGDALEAYLDTQVAGGIAPNANVILYTAADTYLNAGLFLAIQRAIDDNQVDILNVSFGACEANEGAAGNQYINNLWQQAAAQGISVTVSTGDSGSAGCDNQNKVYQASLGLAVNALASTPYNIAVGGTDFDTLFSNFPASFTQYVDVNNTLANHRSALAYIPERPWNDSTFQGKNTTIAANLPWTATQYSSNANIWAGGGGFSACVQQSAGTCSAGYPVPSWQAGFAPANYGRSVPDVSLMAGDGLYGAAWGLCTDQEYDSFNNLMVNCSGTPTTGNNFNVTGVGGTSASAPAFAGMLALLKQKNGSRLGQADYVLYDLAKSKYGTVFHDIATGNNSVACVNGSVGCAANTGGYYFMSGYNTATGFDEATGLGSIDGTQLLNNWAGAGVTATTSALTLNGAASALNITHGASVAVHVGVTGSGGTPAGDVALVDNINPATVPNSGSIDVFTLTGGVVSGTTNNLPGGSYTVSAHYGGSQSFGASDSNAIPVTVSAEASTVSLKLSGYFDPTTGKAAATPYYGYIYVIDAQPIGKSASVASPNGAATGSITFKSGATTLGSAILGSDGIAELQTTSLPGGTDNLTAAFAGDVSFQASTSATVPITVVPAVTTLGVNASPPLMAGLPTTFDVSLTTNSAGAAPTGTLTFQNGSTVVGSTALVGSAASSTKLAGGSASFFTGKLPIGTYNITVFYSGDSNYASSTSSPVSVTVLPAHTTMMVSPPTSATPVNQAIPVIVSVLQSTNDGLQIPTGTVTLSYNNVTSAPVNISTGVVTITIPANSLSVGATTVTAQYSGDLYYEPNTATGTVNTIGSGTLKPVITVTGPTGVTNYPISISVSVKGASGSPTPTGNVSFPTLNNNPSAPLTNGVANFVVQSGLFDGDNKVYASYLGDSNYTNGNAFTTITLITHTKPYFQNFAPAIAVGDPLSVTLIVRDPSFPVGPAPTGTVTFTCGSYTSSPVTVVGSIASVTIPGNSLAVGSDTLTASYSGDVNYTPASVSESVPVMQPGFTISAPTTIVGAGATSGNTSLITVLPNGGFIGSVALTAAITNSPAGAVNLPTLSFGSTSPVSITGVAPATATLTISTKAPTTAGVHIPARPGSLWYTAGGTALGFIVLFGVPARLRRWRNLLGALALFVVLASGMVACGGGGGGGGGVVKHTIPGTTPGTYTVNVTGTSGALTTVGTVMVTVY